MAGSSIDIDRPKAKNLRYLSRTAGFLKPYWRRGILAIIALTVTALAILALGQGLRQLIDGNLDPRTFVGEFFELSEAGNLRVDIRKRLILGLLTSDTIRPSIKFLFLENLERLPAAIRLEIINEAMNVPNKPSLEAIKQELAWIRLSLPPEKVN